MGKRVLLTDELLVHDGRGHLSFSAPLHLGGASLPLGAAILVPRLDVFLRQPKALGEVCAVHLREVFLATKLPLQLLQLLGCEGSPLLLAERISSLLVRLVRRLFA